MGALEILRAEEIKIKKPNGEFQKRYNIIQWNYQDL